MELQLPQSQRKTVETLLSLDTEKLTAIIGALERINPNMSFRDAIELVASDAGIGERDARRILILLAGLFGVQERPTASRENIVGRVMSAIEADSELLAPTTELQRQQTRKFLDQALALEDSLGITSKAWNVTRDYERTYCSSRTLSDLRPVFKMNADAPAAFIVIHNLRITFHQGDEMHEFFVALRTKDLEDLTTVLERATSKGRKLRQLVEQLNAPVVEVE